MFVPWSMGRQESIWPDPLRFDPSRYIDAASGKFVFPSASKHPAFLAGPRTCLGKDVAYLGAGLLLTLLLDRFDFELCEPDVEPIYDTGLTLWVLGGLKVLLKAR